MHNTWHNTWRSSFAYFKKNAFRLLVGAVIVYAMWWLLHGTSWSTIRINSITILAFVIAPLCGLYSIWGILRNKSFENIFTGIRFMLCILILLSGIGKFAYNVGHFPFPSVIGPPEVEEKLAAHGLAAFGRFIAYSQVFVGCLLFTRRFATIGAIMLFPILLCITMVTLSQGWGIAMLNIVFVLLNIALLLSDWHRLKFLLHEDRAMVKATPLHRVSLKLDAVYAAGIVAVLVGVTQAYRGIEFVVGMISAGVITFAATTMLQFWQSRSATTAAVASEELASEALK
jgi:hypothetical protein